MKIIADAFGGDNAPRAVLEGCAAAQSAMDVDILLVGREEEIRACAKENNIDISKMEIKHADGVMEMTDTPKEILKSKKNTSMAVGLQALADGEGDAFLSAGSTGALLMGATFIVKRIKGVKRPAIAGVMPSTDKPFLLMDTGANVDCTPQMLCQFARLGSIYMEKIMNVQNPRVGLANIGTEETKGTALQVEAYGLLSEMSGINFTGNTEVREIALGAADVIVADGFTGNVILKMYEGVAKALLGEIKKVFTSNLRTKLSYLGVKPELGAFRAKMDYKQYGGAPLIGIRKPVIKAHGSSDAVAFENAVRQAVRYTEGNVIAEIEKALGEEKQ